MNNRLDQFAFIEKCECGFFFHFWRLLLFELGNSSNWWYNIWMIVIFWRFYVDPFIFYLFFWRQINIMIVQIFIDNLEGFPGCFNRYTTKDDVRAQADFTSSVAFRLFTWGLGQSGTAGSVWIPISTPSVNICAYPDRFRLTFSEELSDASRSSDIFDAAGGSCSIIIKSYSLSTCCCCCNSISNKVWRSLSTSIASLRWQFRVVFWSIQNNFSWQLHFPYFYQCPKDHYL